MEKEMTYSHFINVAIKKNKLTLDQISELTNKHGNHITYSYLSKLKNGKTPPPSPKVSLVLSRILNIPLEVLLAASQYEETKVNIQKIKEVIQDAHPELDSDGLDKKCWDIVTNFNQYITPSTYTNEDSKVDSDIWHVSVFERIVSKDSLDMLKTGRVGTKKVDLNRRNFITPYLDDYIFIIAPDNSMVNYRIHKNDLVLIEVQDFFENEDIIAVNINDNDAVLRKIRRLEDNNFWLFSSGSDSKPIIYKKEICRIVGKVIQVMYEF